MIRTRNFKVRIERVGTGVLLKTQKVEKRLLFRDRRQKCRKKTFERKCSWRQQSLGKETSKTARFRHGTIGILPNVQHHKTESVCKFGDKCVFKYTEGHRQPSSKTKKSGGKDRSLC